MATKKKKTAKKAEGLKANGTLKKGYKYAKGGKVVKSSTSSTTTTKKKTPKKVGAKSLLKDLKKQGLRLPHGYEVVKRTRKK